MAWFKGRRGQFRNQEQCQAEARHTEDFARRHQHDQDVFHTMLDMHTEFERKVEKLPDGIRTVTTSKNPEIVALLHDHVPSMHDRLLKGLSLRNWDPLYIELFKHREALEMNIELLDDGVRVVERSDQPEVVPLIHAHADAVDGFLEGGRQRASQPSPMPADYAG
ncbi:MAG: hypothetical protein ACWA44_00250 [Thiotrichales bacterium]